jgi:hypothetical protein
VNGEFYHHPVRAGQASQGLDPSSLTSTVNLSHALGPHSAEVQAVDALAQAVADRRAAPRIAIRRPAAFSPPAIASIAIAMLLSCGSTYLIYNGQLQTWIADRNSSAREAQAASQVIDQYNSLIASGNQLAKDHQFAQAMEKFRDARIVASATPAVKDRVDLDKLDGIIAHYDQLAQANATAQLTPAEAEPRVPLMDTASLDIRYFAEEPALSSAVPADKLFVDIAPPPTQRQKPHAVASPHPEKPKEPASRINAYTKPD